MVENPPANSGNEGLSLGPGRCPGEGSGNPFQYSFLGNLTDRGAWRGYSPGDHRELDRT